MPVWICSQPTSTYTTVMATLSRKARTSTWLCAQHVKRREMGLTSNSPVKKMTAATTNTTWVTRPTMKGMRCGGL